MYRYDHYDQRLVDERVIQFRDQTRRHLAGELSGEEFRPLRLQNGLYLLRHASMLRIAIPYGLASSAQLRQVARVSRRYGLGDVHFTTRQNLQFNGPALADVPEILADLAEVQMHAIQTSGSCIRGITSDPLAGAAADEIVDPRPWCEILRQWSSLHPEFTQLPRKFKVAVNGAREDRTLLLAHDLGLDLVRDAAGEIGFRVLVGGGLGRSPMLAQEIAGFIAWPHLLSYCEAVLRVYNLLGRRDDLHKARLKVLVRTLGIADFRERVEEEWRTIKDGPLTLTEAEVRRVSGHFTDPALERLPADDVGHRRSLSSDPGYAAWVRQNVRPHKRPGYAIVTLSTKGRDVASGDLTPEQLDEVAQWADAFSFGEVRVTHEQNLVLAHVRLRDLRPLWDRAREAGLAAANRGLLTDIIACPGGRYCDLASTETAPVVRAIQVRFDNREELADIGPLELNVSGCVNACGHHPVGHIGIRGVEKHGQSYFQVSVGGRQGRAARFGTILGPAVSAAEVPEVVESLVATYRGLRRAGEHFIDTLTRVGHEPFKRGAQRCEQTPRKVANG